MHGSLLIELRQRLRYPFFIAATILVSDKTIEFDPPGAMVESPIFPDIAMKSRVALRDIGAGPSGNGLAKR